MTLNTSLEEIMNAMGAQAAIAARELGRATTEQKNNALIAAAQNLRAQTEELLTANRLDMDIANFMSSSSSSEGRRVKLTLLSTNLLPSAQTKTRH